MDSVIEVNKNKPVLDWLVPVVQSMVHYGEATVATGRNRAAIGLAMDLCDALYNLDASLHTHVSVLGHGDDMPDSGKSVDSYGKHCGASSYTFRVILDKDRDFDTEMPQSTVWGCVIKTADRGRLSSIYVRATDSDYVSGSKVADMTRAIMDEGEFPDKEDKTRLLMHYKQSAFPLNLAFQVFDAPLKTVERNPEVVSNYYPVSGNDKLEIGKKEFDYFQEPLFWDGWSGYHSAMFNVMAGLKSIADLMRVKDASSGMIKSQLDKARPYSLMILEKYLGSKIYGSDLYSEMAKVCDNVRCPPKYSGIFLSKTLKTLRYLFCDEILTNENMREVARNVIESYNHEQTGPNANRFSLDLLMDSMKEKIEQK